jgi:hypothetical protein
MCPRICGQVVGPRRTLWRLHGLGNCAGSRRLGPHPVLDPALGRLAFCNSGQCAAEVPAHNSLFAAKAAKWSIPCASVPHVVKDARYVEDFQRRAALRGGVCARPPAPPRFRDWRLHCRKFDGVPFNDRGGCGTRALCGIRGLAPERDAGHSHSRSEGLCSEVCCVQSTRLAPSLPRSHQQRTRRSSQL